MKILRMIFRINKSNLLDEEIKVLLSLIGEIEKLAIFKNVKKIKSRLLFN